jgi:hypothetical protein
MSRHAHYETEPKLLAEQQLLGWRRLDAARGPSGNEGPPVN